MKKKIDAFERKTKETYNEDIVTGTVAGKLAMPDKGDLIRDRDGNEFIVECSKAAFWLARLDPMTCQEELRTYKEASCNPQA